MSWRRLNTRPGVPETPAPVVIDSFLGVDFRGGDVAVDPRRSPDACNMTFGPHATIPQKRTGYCRVLGEPLPGPVYGIHRLEYRGEEQLLVHSGTTLYRVVGDRAEPVFQGLREARSRSFVMGGKLYLLEGRNYLRWDGTRAEPVRNVAYAPTTVTARPPAGGGTPLESVNLLTGRRHNEFIGDGKSTQYRLDAKLIAPPAVRVTVDGEERTEGTDFTVDRNWGVVTFSSPPPAAAAGAGVPNVCISFEATVFRADRIEGCTVFGVFGGDNDTRVFLSGNPEEPGVDFQSGLYDPTYFPDTGYTRIGTDGSAVLGYVKQYDTQLILKAGTGQEAVQYLRTFSLDEQGKAVFPVCQGAAGVGALAPGTFAALLDEPLFLSPEGVRAVVGTAVDLQRNIQPRSELVDARLLREPELADAQAAVLGDRYLLFAGGHVYVADARLRRTDELGQLQYEWQYWEGIDAYSVLSDGNRLWFGDRAGNLFRLMGEEEPGCYLDDGRPISCHWSTPFFSFGHWDRRKSLSEVTVTLMPFSRSSCQVCYATQERRESVREVIMADTLRLDDVDFDRFSFRALGTPLAYRVRSKERGFQLFRLILRSCDRGQGEGFGIASLQMNCRLSGKIK